MPLPVPVMCLLSGLIAIISFGNSGKYLLDRPLRTWAWQRKLYAFCWITIGFCYVAATGCIIAESVPATNLCIGISFFFMGLSPCSFAPINRNWWLRVPRNLYFYGASIWFVYYGVSGLLI